MGKQCSVLSVPGVCRALQSAPVSSSSASQISVLGQRVEKWQRAQRLFLDKQHGAGMGSHVQLDLTQHPTASLGRPREGKRAESACMSGSHAAVWPSQPCVGPCLCGHSQMGILTGTWRFGLQGKMCFSSARFASGSEILLWFHLSLNSAQSSLHEVQAEGCLFGPPLSRCSCMAFAVFLLPRMFFLGSSNVRVFFCFVLF